MSANLTPDVPQRNRLHPLVAGAAVSVILASAAGVAAMTGILPLSKASTAEPAAMQSASAPVVGAASTTASAVQAAQPAPTYAQTAPRTAPEQAPARPKPHHYRAPQTTYSNGGEAQPYAQQRQPYVGEVASITPVQTAEPTTGLGALGGAVAGGLIGNQIGNGRGRTVATIAGALGGGLAGNGIEHAVRKATTYQVQVRMQDGSYRNFTYQTPPSVQVGERVRVEGDSLVGA
ncbi:glycine zipper 2TM domain-containing protein [Paraburkholderia kururiensis]|uniref:glycine zipper 2TM domain-containing protein n=1 Tax=Paraburkholderia kururiensis TaxID=984307 RepID=UPI00034771E0|nr:glycine zipper 2TM domain-containing protein [Paraburkholderia kururiensis]